MQKLYCGSLIVDLTDETADLLWAYHSALCACDRSAPVEIPVSMGGAFTSLRLNLTPSTPLGLLPITGFTESPGRREGELLGILRLQLAILDAEEPRTTVA
jgi:hypothetical protein